MGSNFVRNTSKQTQLHYSTTHNSRLIFLRSDDGDKHVCVPVYLMKPWVTKVVILVYTAQTTHEIFPSTVGCHTHMPCMILFFVVTDASDMVCIYVMEQWVPKQLWFLCTLHKPHVKSSTNTVSLVDSYSQHVTCWNFQNIPFHLMVRTPWFCTHNRWGVNLLVLGKKALTQGFKSTYVCVHNCIAGN